MGSVKTSKPVTAIPTRLSHVLYEILKIGLHKKRDIWGWGFSSVVERLPRKRKALGSVPSSEKKKEPKKKKKSETYKVSDQPRDVSSQDVENKPGFGE